MSLSFAKRYLMVLAGIQQILKGSIPAVPI